jgi:hypothetical protein
LKVAIVGAGIAGLSCARELTARGASPTVFEKSRGPGGRCATRRSGHFFWDSGATSLLPRGKTLERVITEELDTSELVRVTKPVAIHENLRVRPGDPGRGNGNRYCYQNGINTLAKLLGQGLNVRANTPVSEVRAVGDQFEIAGEAFDHLVLTAPIPQVSLMLWSLNETRPLANVRYRACISIMLGYETPLPERPYFALLDPEQSHPLTWLSLESVKVPGRPSTLVAQMNRSFSRREYERPDSDLVASILPYLVQLVGPEFGKPVVSSVMRWKYSQPESFARFEDVNPARSRLWIASDGLLGGHLEDAYEIGVRVASLITS